MRRTRAYFYSAIAIAIILAFGTSVFGQSNQLQKTWEWSYQVSGNATLELNNYDCDLQIHTWDQGTIQYKMTVDATLKSEEDVTILNGNLEKLDFSNSAGRVEIDNRFWENRKTVGTKSTMNLKGGDKVRYSKFKMKGELWIPVGCNLELVSKYSVIELEDLQNGASMKLYNDKVYAHNIGGPLAVEAKYSTLEFADLKDVSAEFYSTDLEAGNAGNLTIKSKYSEVKAEDVGNITLNSYSDKFSFTNTGNIKFVNKYSDLNAGKTGIVEVEGYTSKLILASAERIKLKSKYGKFEVGETTHLNITSAYSDKVEIGKLTSLDIQESKYGTYKAEELTSSLVLENGYSDKFFITKTSQAFKGFKVKGRYLDAEIGVDPGLDFRFKADVQYPSFDIGEEEMTIKIKIKESSKLQMEAIKGTEAEGMPLFQAEGYNVKIELKEY